MTAIMTSDPADSLRTAGVARSPGIAFRDLLSKHLGDVEFRGKERRRIQYAILTAFAVHGGLEPRRPTTAGPRTGLQPSRRRDYRVPDMGRDAARRFPIAGDYLDHYRAASGYPGTRATTCVERTYRAFGAGFSG